MQQINFKIHWHGALIVCLMLLLGHLHGWSQEYTQVKGKVTDKNGKPIPGTSISLEGSKIGTTSDLNGFYQVQVPGLNGKLIFSNVGYIKKEIALALGEFVYDVVLEEDLLGLEEVVADYFKCLFYIY